MGISRGRQGGRGSNWGQLGAVGASKGGGGGGDKTNENIKKNNIIVLIAVGNDFKFEYPVNNFF